MRKISIARRRIETMDQKPSLCSVNDKEPELVPFHRRNEGSNRLLSISGGKSRQPSPDNRPETIEVFLNPSQMAADGPFRESESQSQVSGTLCRKEGGVLYLNLELSGTAVPKFISAKTIAEMLEITPGTVYRMHKQNKLPGIRIGRTLRFSFKDVIDYLGSCAEEVEG